MNKYLILLTVIVVALNASAEESDKQTMTRSDYEYVGALYFMSPHILDCATANIRTLFPTKKVLISAMSTAEFEACLASLAKHKEPNPAVGDERRQLRIEAGKHASMLAAQ